MKECNQYDNWCEKEKRSCKNCYYERGYNMSDEEMKVIDLLKNIDKQKCIMLDCPVVKNNIERQLKIIELNRIIRKQSKEIEELKEIIKRDYISKKKLNKKIEDFKIIRDTIIQNEKDLNRSMMTYDLKRNDYCEKMLQSLLEEEE